MDAEAVQSPQVVDPEVRAYVYSLVTALGGTSDDDSGRYVLGDDALACLRDIKKWLKFYDERANRMDVARCLAEANLVNGDLVPILATWWQTAPNQKHKMRIALASLELLVPLTWPVEIHSQMTVNHHRHTPYLQQSQVFYKRGIIGNQNASILRAAIRLGLPSMAISRSERSARDEGILKIMLYLFRNLAIITPSRHLAIEGDEEEASRSATIDAFQQQDVFALLLTMCSNMGDDFTHQDVIVLEVLFHLVKGIDAQKVFMSDTQRKAKNTDELQELLQKEAHMKREYSKNESTRHGRFGTMIWVKRDDEKMSSVSGQDVLKSYQNTLTKMDKSKKWNKPRGRRGDIEQSINDFNSPATLTSPATKNLRMFVDEFLDSGFNPLFSHLRKAIEREADRVTEAHSRQFFYVVSWFLEAERVRRSRQKESREKNSDPAKTFEPDSYGLVASVLNQEMFVSLNRFMQKSMDDKEYRDLNAGMRCFTQILLTVQEMTQSPLEEDQEIADNIQNRIFYEETTHDRILAILRNYKDQGFGYLDSCTELTHVFLRLLERYSKENADMQIRSKRRARQKKKSQAQSNQNDGENVEDDGDQESEAEDLAEAARVSKERKFDFQRFAAKFCSQRCVDTFAFFTKYYKDLNDEQLKRAHRFFYRAAFKQEMSVLLFRVDIIAMFYRMIKGPEGLDPGKPIFREWEELVRQILRRLTKKLEQRPELITEMLFSKINSTLFYLEYGHEKQTMSESKPAAELDIRPGSSSTTDQKLGIVVSALVRDDKSGLVKWLMKTLRSAADERKSWEAEAEARATPSEEQPASHAPAITAKPNDSVCRTAMFKNGRFRLLMTLAELEISGEDVIGAPWTIPSSVKSESLESTCQSLEKYSESPMLELDGDDPESQIVRKRSTETRETYQTTLNVDFGSDSEGDDAALDGPLFPPNIRSRSATLDVLKKKRKLRKKNDGEKEPLDEEILEARRQARAANALERQRKIKSDLYIHASDEESDAGADLDFFEKEEQRRKEQAQRVRHALLTGSDTVEKKGKSKSKRKAQASSRKRKNQEAVDDDESDDSARKRRRSSVLSLGSDIDDDMDIAADDDVDTSTSAKIPKRRSLSNATVTGADEDTPLTSAEDDDIDFEASEARRLQPAVDEKTSEAQDDDEEDIQPVASSARRRTRGGFVIDSDSE